MSRRRQSYQPTEPTDPRVFYAAHYGEQKRRDPADLTVLHVAPTERPLRLGQVVLFFGIGAGLLLLWPLYGAVVRLGGC